MRLLVDTHLLLWAATRPELLSSDARSYLGDPANDLLYSVASLWEVAIKTSLGRESFRVDAGLLRRGLLANGYAELAISGLHAAAVAQLPAIHKDPFDRLLVAQATVENLTLLTSDAVVARYPGSIRNV
ncbi:type II toxin-antitoxin system VapC family toxin [Methylobacterium durans]|uniref:type II toxin-antitoxin system VapC family toxin n=1 Tax=Methylobacterium durans TaxID=2202825 RepID=UPI002AFF898D|nr:type II toxin-antitoxin system VapC family toxin [Methylobacterium durans]MEA1835113.1 type II toxin-antitoxin system VapC family toxin [Methylobacterium durans]